MKISKSDNTLEADLIIEMTPDEYGEVCKFMKDNGVGYGQGRRVTEKFRLAKEIFEKEKNVS